MDNIMGLNVEAFKKSSIPISKFKHPELLEIALTHPNHIYDRTNIIRPQQKQQVLEHQGLANLGYVVFSRVISKYLSKNFSSLGKATLIIIESDIVSIKMLSEFAKDLKLRQFSQLGKSYKWKHKSEKNKMLAQMFEALIGVIYLEFDKDLERTSHWLVEHFIAEAVNQLLTLAFKDDSDLETDFQLIDWIEVLQSPLLNPNSSYRKNNSFLEC
ncbi:MAG: ribonuclease III domain-containing protein [Trichodesmium sp. ALOHA_ZT_67]|nr:ribonuclease III domain-containing protein [Trichodesmium sp. ALOHA_ZT_67]